MADRFEIRRTIPAAPEAIFRVLADPQGHVAIDSSGMLMAATGEPVLLAPPRSEDADHDAGRAEPVRRLKPEERPYGRP